MLELLDDGLVAVRAIRAPRTDIFDAWVNPQRLRQWWGPPGVTVTDVKGELRVGGHYRISMLRDDRERVELVWTFREISPPERLAFDWRWTAGLGEPSEQSLVTVAFREAGERTEVTVTHLGIASAGARDSHAAGWIGCLDGLAEILTHMV